MKRHVSRAIAVCFLVVAAAATLVALTGCTTPTASGAELVKAGRPLKAASGQVTDKFAGAVNDFGVDLLKATRASAEKGENVVVSPASVHAALSMTGNGATDETAEQMRTVLRTTSMTPAEANAQWASLLAGLADRSPEQTLEVANSLWARKGIPFKQPFLDADRDFFGAEFSALDFAKDDVVGAINGWVSKNTNGMIPKMLEQPPSAQTILYLANAVYFKGDWVTPFKHDLTDKQSFTRADGSKVDVDMMHSFGPLPYAQNASLQATKLLYKGLDASYYVMLPREGVTVDAALASLGGTGLTDLRTAMMAPNLGDVTLALPKLDTEFGTSLNDPLKAMGMPRAFDGATAQFSGIADLSEPIFIANVTHKTKVKVDEKGTEAAAATVVEQASGSAPPAVEPPRIICDRPYVFAIVDEKTGTLLFLGVVDDPTR
jgi:serpin B